MLVPSIEEVCVSALLQFFGRVAVHDFGQIAFEEFTGSHPFCVIWTNITISLLRPVDGTLASVWFSLGVHAVQISRALLALVGRKETLFTNTVAVCII